MTNKRIEGPHEDLTYRIIGAAMAVHRQWGPGLKEQQYQRSLEISFTEMELSYTAQQNLPVYDRDVLVGFYIPDFIVEERVVVEIKALGDLDNSHLAQVIGYLAVTGCPVGLLINFGTRSLQYRRILPPRNISEHRINRQWLFVPDWLKGEG
ncbi:MAG: GxxExxY protein [Chloroflexi bacterium]|nr:GxxExxY protein [Chloroflexota bacterium]